MSERVPFSKKQLAVLKSELKPFTFIVGVTGSGKSYIGNIIAYDRLVNLHRGQSALFCGNTTESLYKNVIKELLAIDEGIGHIAHIGNRIVTANGAEAFCVGVNNDGAQKRLTGGSVVFGYADEPQTYPQQAFDMISSRCRGVVNGELVFHPLLCTLNPDDETHYIKAKIDAGGDDTLTYFFGFWDNPTMNEKFITQIEGRYSGVFYDRMVKGIWTGDPGRRIVPEFDEAAVPLIVREHPRPNYYHAIMAIDPGMNDKTGIVLGYYDYLEAKAIVVDSLKLDAKNTIDIAEQVKAMIKKHFPGEKVTIWSDVDLRLIADLNSLHGLRVYQTVKDYKGADEKTNLVRYYFDSRDGVNQRLRIHPRATDLIRQARIGMWNKNRASFDRSEADGHFDVLDAMIIFLDNLNKTNPYPASVQPVWDSQKTQAVKHPLSGLTNVR